MSPYLSWIRFAASAVALCGMSRFATASIISDFNSGDILVDYTFDDVAGTDIPGAANSGDASLTFDSDSDSADVVTNGLGQLATAGKDNTNFGSNYIDLPLLDAGRVIGLFEVSWEFDESEFNSSQDEEFRLSLVPNDPRSTFVTAEIFFRRTSATEVTLFGNGVGDASTDTPDVIFGSSGSLLTMIDVDIQSREFELFYSSDGGATFTSAGTGLTGDFDDETAEIDIRPVSSVRLVLNEDFSDDTVLIERFAVSFVPEPSALLLVCGASLALSARRNRLS